MNQHTPGLLKVQHPHAGERGWEIAFEPGLEQVCQNVTEANARRLVACWNSLHGILTTEIEAAARSGSIAYALSKVIAQRDELLDALKALYGWCKAETEHFDSTGPDEWIMEKALTAIEKTEGTPHERT